MEIIQELPASLINSKQISEAIPKEKIDLWKTRCQQEYCKSPINKNKNIV